MTVEYESLWFCFHYVTFISIQLRSSWKLKWLLCKYYMFVFNYYVTFISIELALSIKLKIIQITVWLITIMRDLRWLVGPFYYVMITNVLSLILKLEISSNPWMIVEFVNTCLRAGRSKHRSGMSTPNTGHHPWSNAKPETSSKEVSSCAEWAWGESSAAMIST